MSILRISKRAHGDLSEIENDIAKDDVVVAISFFAAANKSRMLNRGYLIQHALPMLLAAIASAALTAVVILGGQALLRRRAAGGKELQASLLGKWELIEPLADGIEPGEIWFEMRPDQTLQWCKMTTVHIDGNLSSKEPDLHTYEYRVPDSAHLVLDPGGQSEHKMRVVLSDDGLTLFKRYGQVERFRRAKFPER